MVRNNERKMQETDDVAITQFPKSFKKLTIITKDQSPWNIHLLHKHFTGLDTFRIPLLKLECSLTSANSIELTFQCRSSFFLTVPFVQVSLEGDIL